VGLSVILRATRSSHDAGRIGRLDISTVDTGLDAQTAVVFGLVDFAVELTSAMGEQCRIKIKYQ
jgi:hypothetical protein